MPSTAPGMTEFMLSAVFSPRLVQLMGDSARTSSKILPTVSFSERACLSLRRLARDFE